MAEIYLYWIDPKTRIYHFHTIHGIEFKIIIVNDRSWFPYNPEFTDVFTFEVSAVPKSRFRDPKIQATITDIVSKRIIVNPEMIITYHCDDADGKARSRNRKFDAWHQLVSQEEIHKYNREVIYQDELFYSSLLIHRDNTRYKRAIEIYYSGDKDVTDKFDLD
ncbi:DUF6169 family protein [Dyadobacter sp. CY347]|uniref:DUF6169 family protein n=1 Tax=Dyadobacter sp. CY347 TaxID=2909336 RepID=UPI001F443792|nr:DUF6169 family protein [Dyadobacter sp. CY347]MCF2489390.1 DUF6169 family protein [Dyadobacter sp. CY347]